MRHAVLNTKRKRRSYFYLRAAEALATASEYVDAPPLLRKLEQLKKEIRSCGRPVRDYPCEWTSSGFAGLEDSCRRFEVVRIAATANVGTIQRDDAEIS